MKKVLSIAAVLVLLLALAAPALAAEVNYPSVTSGDIAATSDDGTGVEIVYANPSEVNEGSLTQAIANSGAVTGDNYTVNVYQAYALDADGNKTDRNAPIAITFDCDHPDQVVAAFLQNDDGSWVQIDFKAGNGNITVYALHLTPIALVYKTEASAPTPDSGSVKSPFTGDYTVIWAAAAVAMALCAGALFVSARKKAAE